MNTRRRFDFIPTLALMFALAAVATSGSSSAAEVGEWIGLFNGKDRTGWRFQEPALHSQWTVGTAALDPQDPVDASSSPVGTS